MKNLSNIIEQSKTIHSITEAEANIIDNAIRKYKPKSFLDFGCHLGHLTIRLAVEFEMTIYAVDNFIGSSDDKKMEQTIDRLTEGNGNFHYLLMKNIEEASLHIGFKSKINVLHTDRFFEIIKDPVDFAFIDSSHDSHQEFIDIDELIPSGGILAGHDNTDRYERNKGVLEGIAMIKDKYKWIRNDFLFIMQKK